MILGYQESEFIHTKNRGIMVIFNIVESVYRKMSRIPDVFLEDMYIAPPISIGELSEIEKK